MKCVTHTFLNGRRGHRISSKIHCDFHQKSFFAASDVPVGSRTPPLVAGLRQGALGRLHCLQTPHGATDHGKKIPDQKNRFFNFCKMFRVVCVFFSFCVSIWGTICLINCDVHSVVVALHGGGNAEGNWIMLHKLDFRTISLRSSGCTPISQVDPIPTLKSL